MLAVITCHFNWTGAHTPVRNLARFLRHMQEFGVPVYGVEIFLEGTVPRMLKNPQWKCIKVTERSKFFQKENLLNMAETLVPPGYSAIAALDHDIQFLNRSWVQDSIQALKEYKILQPFTSCEWTDRLGRRHLRRESCVIHGVNSTWKGHPGFAWVTRRDFYSGAGWYPYGILGSGDTTSASAILQLPLVPSTAKGVGLPQQTNGVIDSYWSKLDRYNQSQATWIPGNIIHEWHGDYTDRNYHHRCEITKDFDALTHIEKNKDGIWEWSQAAPLSLIEAINQHFIDRREDG